MNPRVVVLGAGFGGLELATILSDSLGDRIDLTLIDKSETFVFGYSKLDVMFGRATPEAVRLPYRKIFAQGFLTNVLNPKVAVFFPSRTSNARPDVPGDAYLSGVMRLPRRRRGGKRSCRYPRKWRAASAKT